MTVDSHHQRRLGIVVIGRNEGERLRQALQSVRRDASTGVERIVLYVDSGSTDGSLELAISMGVSSHSLDPVQPFSAARARLEGAEQLMKENPDLQFIQFLDGDCVLHGSWLRIAVNYLQQRSEAGIVCGKLEEDAPERSAYNRLNAIRWRGAQIGEVAACGGIFLIRASVYTSAGGFDPRLLTGEEADLCSRVRASGHRVVRLNTPMASHDSNLLTFRDWWRRAVWGGYGDALEYQIRSGDVSPARRRETRSVILWVLVVPLAAIAGIFLSLWRTWLLVVPALCLLGYAAVLARVVWFRRQRGDSYQDAVLYSILNTVRKVPYGIGFVRRMLKPGRIEMRPDPRMEKC